MQHADGSSDATSYRPAKIYEVHLHPDPETPSIPTGLETPQGTPVNLDCATCHSTKTPNLGLRDASQLKDFHQDLTVAHGNLNCLSCHDQNNYDELHLADGTGLAFRETKMLCAQCHGPQHRDYEHGSHGGMTGYWDLSQGPRVRNTCTVCHDPHAPAYPQVYPVPLGAEDKAVTNQPAYHQPAHH